MKRFYLLLLCFTFLAACAFAQRNIDLAVTITSPAAGSTVTGNQSFNLGLTLTNNGPDVIKTTDTFLVSFLLDNGTTTQSLIVNGQTTPALAGVFSQQVASGAGAGLSQAIALATFPGAGSHSLCAVAQIVNRSTDSVHETQPANNKTCVTLTFQNATAVANTAVFDGAVSVYPNPANGLSTIRIDLLKQDQVTVVITDVYGRVVFGDTRLYPSGISTIPVATGNFAAGTYWYKVQTSSGSGTGKLLIVH